MIEETFLIGMGVGTLYVMGAIAFTFAMGTIDFESPLMPLFAITWPLITPLFLLFLGTFWLFERGQIWANRRRRNRGESWSGPI